MQEVHAVLLTGGSAYGLAAADGVMRYLEEHQSGYKTPWGRIPIVPAAVVFDLNLGSPLIRPGPDSGYKACLAAARSPLRQGSLGVGIGATVGKWAGPEYLMKGGFGLASVSDGKCVVTAVVVVNAVGDVLGPSGDILAGARSKEGHWLADEDPFRTIRFSRARPSVLSNTTLAALLTNARLTKVEANRAAQRGHDGLARALKPVHTSFDGDVVFALASGGVSIQSEVVAELGAEMIARAIRNAVVHASPVGNVPALSTGAP